MSSKSSLERRVFLVSLVGIIFLAGGVFGYKGWQPIRFVQENYSNLIKLINEFKQVRPKLLEEIRTGYPKITPDLGSASPGYTLIQGVFGEGVQLKLLNLRGEMIHAWEADFFSIWPEPDDFIHEKNFPKNRYSYHTQGVWALADGSVIISFSPGGLVKLDKCGKLIWKLDRMTHHSVTPTGDGAYWAPVKGTIGELDEKFLLPGMSVSKITETGEQFGDSIILVSRDGEVIKEFPVFKALFNGDFKRQLYDVNLASPDDPTHVNDIEIVTPELAAKIPGITTGDLLVSLRQMHMLLIMDQLDGKIKWHTQGPWIRQHDPDITQDGRLVIFNNEFQPFHENGQQASSIDIFDPATGNSSVLFAGSIQQPFYSRIMGVQQILANGNILITESMAGRVFEINTDTKKIVWEWKKNYDETHATIIESGIRYKPDYFQVENWSCN